MKELIRFRQFLAEGFVNENQMKNLAKLLRDEADQPDNKVGKDIFLKYAAQAEKTDVKDIRSLLQKLEDELIGKHPDTFSGEDDIVGSFLSVSKNYTAEGQINENLSQNLIKVYEDEIESLMASGEDDVVPALRMGIASLQRGEDPSKVNMATAKKVAQIQGEFDFDEFARIYMDKAQG